MSCLPFEGSDVGCPDSRDAAVPHHAEARHLDVTHLTSEGVAGWGVRLSWHSNCHIVVARIPGLRGPFAACASELDGSLPKPSQGRTALRTMAPHSDGSVVAAPLRVKQYRDDIRLGRCMEYVIPVTSRGCQRRRHGQAGSLVEHATFDGAHVLRRLKPMASRGFVDMSAGRSSWSDAFRKPSEPQPASIHCAVCRDRGGKEAS